MPVIQGNGTLTKSPTGVIGFHRRLFVSDKNGVFHEIRHEKDIEAIIAQMTPQEYEDWKARYRFTQITNLTGNPNYMGTSQDLG